MSMSAAAWWRWRTISVETSEWAMASSLFAMMCSMAKSSGIRDVTSWGLNWIALGDSWYHSYYCRQFNILGSDYFCQQVCHWLCVLLHDIGDQSTGTNPSHNNLWESQWINSTLILVIGFLYEETCSREIVEHPLEKSTTPSRPPIPQKIKTIGKSRVPSERFYPRPPPTKNKQC